MIKKKNSRKTLLKKNNYHVIMELYFLNKGEMKKEARLPINDFRRPVVKKASRINSISLKKALLKIAALW